MEEENKKTEEITQENNSEQTVVQESNSEQTVPQESKGLSIASMVLGIISVVLFCIWYISIPCAILAIIFGVVGMKKDGKGMAIAGLVLGIVALAILLMIYLLAIAGFATLSSALSSMS